MLVDPEQSFEVHVGLVHHIDGPSLYIKDIQKVTVMSFAVSDMNERRNATSQTKHRMHLNCASFILAESPGHQFDTARYRCGVDGEYLPAWEENIRNRFRPVKRSDDVNQDISQFLPDAVFPVPVCPRQRRHIHGLAKAKRIEYPLMGFEAQTNVANRVADGQLTKHHMKKEIVTGQIPHMIISVVLLDYTVKLVARDEISNLGKDILTSVHNLAALLAAKSPTHFKSKNQRTLIIY